METQENQSTAPVMKTKDWIITIFVSILPLVGLIMLFIWAFGENSNPNKANWAKATLIWYAIGIGLWILSMMIFGATMFSAMNMQ